MEKMDQPPKYVKMMEEGEATVDIVGSEEQHPQQQQLNHLPASYVKALVTSFLVSICCCWLLGGIAFVLALFGQRSAFAGDIRESRRLKRASYFVSAVGFVVGLIILIVLTIHVISFVKTFRPVYQYDPLLLPQSYTPSLP